MILHGVGVGMSRDFGLGSTPENYGPAPENGPLEKDSELANHPFFPSIFLGRTLSFRGSRCGVFYWGPFRLKRPVLGLSGTD